MKPAFVTPDDAFAEALETYLEPQPRRRIRVKADAWAWLPAHLEQALDEGLKEFREVGRG